MIVAAATVRLSRAHEGIKHQGRYGNSTVVREDDAVGTVWHGRNGHRGVTGNDDNADAICLWTS